MDPFHRLWLPYEISKRMLRDFAAHHRVIQTSIWKLSTLCRKITAQVGGPDYNLLEKASTGNCFSMRGLVQLTEVTVIRAGFDLGSECDDIKRSFFKMVP